MTKDEIRIEMRKKRRELSKDFISESSGLILDKVIPLIKTLNCIMVYMSSFNEPDMKKLTEYLINNNIRVVVPVSQTSDYTIIPSYISDFNALNKGAYGISEPGVIDKADMNDVDLVLVPGIAFSESGNRLGFGKGYYDKLLADFKGVKMGICYDFQIINYIPSSPHDIKMDIIVTEKRIYHDL